MKLDGKTTVTYYIKKQDSISILIDNTKLKG